MKATGVFNMVMQEEKRESFRSKRSLRNGIEQDARGSMKRLRTNDQSSSSARDKNKRSFNFKFWNRDKQQSSKKIDEKTAKTPEEDAKTSKLKSEIRESNIQQTIISLYRKQVTSKDQRGNPQNVRVLLQQVERLRPSDMHSVHPRTGRRHS